MDEMTLDLTNLRIHRLDVDPRESEDAIEFQLHATLEELDERAIAACADEELRFEELVATRRPSPASNGGAAVGGEPTTD